VAEIQFSAGGQNFTKFQQHDMVFAGADFKIWVSSSNVTVFTEPFCQLFTMTYCFTCMSLFNAKTFGTRPEFGAICLENFREIGAPASG
jgi:phosphoserine phosphatase